MKKLPKETLKVRKRRLFLEFLILSRSIQVTRPTQFHYYDSEMDGINGFDVSIVRYRIYLSSRIFHFLNASIINAHILFKLKHKIDSYHRYPKSYTKFGFMSSLMCQMLKEVRVEISSAKTENSHQPLLVSTSVKPRLSTLRHSETRLQDQHFSFAVPM